MPFGKERYFANVSAWHSQENSISTSVSTPQGWQSGQAQLHPVTYALLYVVVSGLQFELSP